MRYVIGIDFADSSILASMFEETGAPVSSQRVPYPVHIASDGKSYANPDDWKDTAFALIKQMITDNDIPSDGVAGIATCGHPNRLAFLDQDGKPVCDSVLWPYGTTFEEETDQMAELLGEDRLNQICGKVHAVEGALGPAILYFRKTCPEAMEKSKMLLYGKDYLTYCLCGSLVMDISDASGTMLFDVKERCWSKEVLTALNISEEVLPTVLECTGIAGYVSEEAAELTGLAPGTPVYAGLTNKASVALTAGAVHDGSSVPTVSNACSIIAISSDCFIDEKKAAETYCSAIPGEYYLICKNKMCADAIGWYGEEYLKGEFAMPKGKGGTPFKPIEDHAAQSRPGAGGVYFLPYLDGAGLPGLNDHAKGVFYGIRTETTRDDMLRAVLEGASYSVLDCYKYLSDIGIACTDNRYHMMGSAPFWLQMLADMTGYKATTHTGTGGPSMGAAMVAAIASGICSDVEDCVSRFVGEKDIMYPNQENHSVYSNGYAFYKKLTKAVDVLFE